MASKTSNPSADDVTPARDRAQSTTDSIIIEIPSGPAYAISPNSRSHWRVKHRESQELRRLTKCLCLVALIDGEAFETSYPVNLHWTIYLDKRRKMMDRDNATATLKPMMDGLVDGLIIQGDSQDIVRAITVDQVKWADHKGDAKIVVRIEQTA